MTLFDQYLQTGGMPVCIKLLLEKENKSVIKQKQIELLGNYKLDFTKYADNKISSRVSAIYDSIDIMLNQDNQKFKITKIDNTTYKTLENPLTWLYTSGYVIPVYQIELINLPLRSNIKENRFKLFYNDIGFLLAQSGYDHLLKHQNKIYQGLIVENYVAIVLHRYFDTLFYYQKKSSEIDYVIYHDNQVIPIEVKSGENTKAKSLTAFITKYDSKKAYKFTRLNFNQTDTFINFPLYALDFIFDVNE